MEPDEQFVLSGAVHVHGAVDRDVLDAAYALHRKPVLRNFTCFVGGYPGIVGLIVAPAADHQFKIRTILVGENLVPNLRFREVTPEEELLADRYMAVGYMRRAALLLVVVSGHEGIVRIKTENRTRFDGEVLPPAQIHHAFDVVRVLGTL